LEHQKHSKLIRPSFDKTGNIIAPLEGLVLAGGKSSRMGSDKGEMQWHGKPQRYFLADTLQSLGLNTHISCRDIAQVTSLSADYQYITDSFLDLGPMGALLSAFRQNPNVAYLVVACDMPLVNILTFQTLIAVRQSKKIATAFLNPESNFPEPLLTIWEPQSYAVLLSYLAEGYSCPRKVLINSEIAMIPPPDIHCLYNVNRQEDVGKVKEVISFFRSK
jgi:molybdenum cofactor guanylyltransferase